MWKFRGVPLDLEASPCNWPFRLGCSQSVKNNSPFSVRPLSCAQTLDLLWHPLGCSSCCVVSPFFFLSRPFESFFVALRSQTIGFFGSTHSWSPWLLHSFSCSATIPMQMQLQTKVLLHTCSGSPPVHMDIRTQMRLAGREKHICSAGKSSSWPPKSRGRKGEAQAHTKEHDVSFQ